MEANRLYKWHPAIKFRPDSNDLLYAPRTGLYEMKDRVAAIVRWRQAAEEEALNIILILLVGDLT